jgi:hypothetical protein
MDVFKKESKTQVKCFKKFKTKILDVDNFEIYNPAKSQLKFWCILGYRKKSEKILNFENVHCSSRPDLHIYHFCWASNTTNLDLNFFTLVDLIMIYIRNFYFKFSETYKCRF